MVRIFLTLRQYPLCIMLFVSMHIFCAVFLLGFGCLHIFLDDSYMSYYANLLASPSARKLTLWGVVFVIVGILHCMEVVVALVEMVANLRRGRPLRNTTSARAQRNKHVQIVLDWFEWVFGAQGLFGIEGPYFKEVFLAREIVETISQCFQAHRLSTLIARPWINDAYVAAIVVNCWGVPLLQHRFRRNVVHERLACLVTDGMLSVIVSMIIPMIILLPYMMAFDINNYSFPTEVLYDDSSFTSTVMEGRSLFALSMVDGASKLIPHISILMCLHTTRGLLRPLYRRTSSGSSIPADITKVDLEKAADGLVLKSAFTKSESMVGSDAPRSRMHTVVFGVVHGLFVVVGVTILSVHLRAVGIAQRSFDDGGCKQTIRPWFPEKTACSLYEYNCQRRQVTTPPWDGSFAHLDSSTLTLIILSHCPALVVPPTIRQFPSLLAFEVWNSTIVEWSEEAAIDAQGLPRLVYLGIIHSNMTELPVGIRHDLPELLLDIEIIKSNLSALPEDLHVHWPSTLSLVFFEHAQFREFPSTLSKMRIADLSLIGNQISHIDDVGLAYEGMLSLALSGNPLLRLPETIAGGLSTAFLSVEDTPLSVLPPWIDAHVKYAVYASGSRLCPDDDDDDDDKRRTSTKILNCEPQPTRTGRYPLALVEALRR